MLALIQRVRSAHVDVRGHTVGRIGPGLLVLLCAEKGDATAQADRMLEKILRLRIFNDAAGKMNRSVQEAGGGLLVVSQFTLAADTRSGNRPGFGNAAAAPQGRALYDHFLQKAAAAHPVVQHGCFGADMQVHLVNDGPVTIPLRIASDAP